MKKILFAVFVFESLSAFGQTKNALPDTIPLTINKQNTIYVKAVFNKIDTLNLNFDTGTTELVLTNDVMKNKLKSVPKLYDTFYDIKIGNQDYSTRVFDAQLTGHDTDGRFGWDLFKGKVVELNYDKNIMVVHPQLPISVLKEDAFSKLMITFFQGIFFGRKPNFSGYSRKLRLFSI